MGKVDTCFQAKTGRRKNQTLWDGTHLYGLFKGVPPGTSVKIHKCEKYATVSTYELANLRAFFLLF